MGEDRPLTYRENRNMAVHFILVFLALEAFLAWIFLGALNASQAHQAYHNNHSLQALVAAPVLMTLVAYNLGILSYRLLIAPILVSIRPDGLCLWPWGLIPWQDISSVVVDHRISSFPSRYEWLQIKVVDLETYARRRTFLQKVFMAYGRAGDYILYEERRFTWGLRTILAAIEAHRPKVTS